MWSRVWREPLLQFLLIGAAMFAAYGVLNPGSGRAESSRSIEVTVDDLRQLGIAFGSQWHRPPTAEEFTALVEGHIRQEVLYREALALGLDKEDTIVKRRMAQKMEFLAEDVAAAHEPSAAELKAWFQKAGPRFAMPDRATFRHLYFSSDRRHERARTDAIEALAGISGSSATASSGDPFMFQNYYADRAPEQVAKEFGPGFAQALFQLKTGCWQGPIESGYGWHLIWLDSIAPGRVPEFEEVEPDVKAAWLAEQKAESWRKAYQTMRARYQVVLPVPKTSGSVDPRAAKVVR